MDILSYLKNNIVYLDGGMGTILQSKGLEPGELPEKWNISHKDIIRNIHKEYFDAGSNIICTNTFGANILKFPEDELEEIISSAVLNAKKAKEESTGKQEKFIALDIGPLGRLLKPYGDLDFEDAVLIFSKTAVLGEKYGVDLVFIETMNDCYETKAALLAVKENTKLPVFVSNAYNEDEKLMTGATPEAMSAMLEGMGADAVGANCSLGPKQLFNVIERLLKVSSVPVIFKPNAGLPKCAEGKTVFDVLPYEFANDVQNMLKKGVRIAGGCCGTTPEYIKSLTNNDIKPKSITKKNLSVVSSYTHTVNFSNAPVLIGERINPTGKKRFRSALLENDTDYILKEGVNQQEAGIHMLDVNVGIPEIDETAVLKNTVCELQAIIDLPLQIDTSDVTALEKALRYYNGKAMINSVNGKEDSMKSVFPLVKKYGGLVVALTLDENGIPKTAEGRLKIAENILKTAQSYGLDTKDLVFDSLAMAVSADKNAANITLEAIKLIHNKLDANTVLGVSNISFGLPNRDVINSTFFAEALKTGLTSAIINPYSKSMMNVYYSHRVLAGTDENCSDYIAFTSDFEEKTTSADDKKTQNPGEELKNSIIKGFKEKAAELTKEMLKKTEPLAIVNEFIIPALDEVGKGFENKTVYLPQLLISAETAKNSFEEIKESVSRDNTNGKKCTVILATVYGDIHDIGKNIVKLLLENYGFNVIDLGKDVPPEKILDNVLKTNAPIVGLSALMTTTVPQMEKTIKLIKQSAPYCKVAVGGAVLTKEYAEQIGADFYSKDAMETVRFAEKINKELER